ncbi:MAG: diacylglycerol kinase family lipid kinase [Verrucomicrobia bacterium]|nr:diacylglycerol kinase family lipid kinase [Verrucomicrobiota bacterium]
MRDYCIILNPAAKAAREKQVAWQLASVARDACVRLTEAPGHASVLAREAALQGFKTIVAGGGDGTVNEVLQGILGLDVRLGVLPLGTMNVFARELALPMDWEGAWARILRGETRRIDLGHVNGLPIAQLAGVGFDAEVVESVSPWSKLHFGPLAYVEAALRRLRKPLPRLKVEAPEIGARPAAWVLVGLGRLYGGPFPVFPRGSNTNGLLDIILVERFSLKQALQSVARVAWSGHTHLSGITYFQTSELRVSSPPAADGQHLDPALEIDGEWRGRAAVKFGVTRGGLSVAV